MARPSLEHFPVALFASVMGLGGLSLAWRRASRVWDVSEVPYQVFFGLGIVVFIVVLMAYLATWVRFPEAARAEVRHPITMAFVPTITIAILVMATAASDLAPRTAEVAWWIGALGHLAATVGVLTAWSVRADIGPGQVTPAWFIPIVGNVVTPLAARDIGSVDFAWFAFGVGVVFWIGLLPLLLQRLLTHDQPLPAHLLPTHAILIAPPSVILLSWQSLTGRLDDPVGRVLHAAVVMFVILVAAQLGRLRRVPFTLSYWAYTFPLAAASAATIAMAGAVDDRVHDAVGVTMLAMATLVVLGVLAKTLWDGGRGRLFLPEQLNGGRGPGSPSA